MFVTVSTGALAAQILEYEGSIFDDGVDPSRDRLKWKWLKGDAFTQAAVGTPETDTNYRLCVYDRSGGVTRLAAQLVVAAGASWIDLDPKGAKYIDKSGSADGVTQTQVKTGDIARTKAQVKAAGSGLAPLLAAVSGSQFMDQDPSVSAYLVNDAGLCWVSELAPAGTTRNDATNFKAKSP